MARVIHVVFELTMPHRGSWNGRWSGENSGHYIFKDFPPGYFQKNKDRLIGQWEYRWDDGWAACITSSEASGQEFRELKKRNTGFCGYSWMVRSILLDGTIDKKYCDA